MSLLQQHYQTDPDVVFTVLDAAEGVLLHLKTKKYYSLNETGVYIWNFLQKGKNAVEISLALQGEYEVENARDYVMQFLAELKQEGLIRRI